MTNENKQFTSKIKSYHIFILGCLLSSLLILNSNYVNNQRATEKLNKEKSKLFDKIISGRKLEGEEPTEGEEETGPLTESDKICIKGTEELYKYYKTGGNLTDIGLSNETIKAEDTKEEYFLSLINIIKSMTGEEDDDTSSGDGEESLRNLEMSMDDLQEDIISYGKHILPFLVFLVVAILCIPGWIVCCFCCCCNCCCCCCCKKPCCKIPCFIVTYVFYALVVAVCIYGLTQSNKVFVGLSDTECSLLKFFDQFLDGETKQELPRWAGISGITGILDGLYDQIVYLKENTRSNLKRKMNEISSQKTQFIQAMKDSSLTFYDNSYNEFKNVYLITYNLNDINVNGKYVLDLINKIGKFNSEDKFEPDDSILHFWEYEYGLVAGIADEYLGMANDGFTEILDTSSGEILSSLSDGSGTLNELKSSFDDIKSSIADAIIDNSETIDDYGKLGFKLIFGVLGLINIAIAVFMLLICLFSGKMCKNCCCCRCIFKFFTHLLWNILAFLMIITFLVGSLFGLIGQIGSDAMSVISYIVSEDNLGINGTGGDNILVGSLGEAKGYLSTCINGDGEIAQQLGLDGSQIESFDDLYTAEDTINQARDNFTQIKKQKETYIRFKGEIEKRKNLTSNPVLFKSVGNTNTPEFLSFESILEEMNTKIGQLESDASKKQERWKINSNSDKTCGDGDDTLAPGNNEFNPLKCRPYHRDWILESGINTQIKQRVDLLKGIYDLVDKANEINSGSRNSFIDVLNKLRDEYDDYLQKYIDTLDLFSNSISGITRNLRQYSGENSVFSLLKCNFIGTNLKIILKYLKTVLGGNIKTVGICLIVVGCSLVLSISITILMIVIINSAIENKNNQDEQIPDYPVNSHGRVIQFQQ